MPRKKQFDEEHVLQQAMELFREKGYHSTSYHDLVDRLGINRASLYDTYGDKQTLFSRSLDLYQQKNYRRIEELIRSDGPADEKLEALFEAVLADTLQDPQRKGCLMVNTITELASQEPELAQQLERNTHHIEELFARLIRQGQAEGSIPDRRDAGELAKYLFASYAGLQVVAKIWTDTASLRQVKRQILRSVLS